MNELVAQIEEELKNPRNNLNELLTNEVISTQTCEDLLTIAELLTKHNHYHEAKRVLSPIIDAEVKSGQAYYLMGNISVALNQIETAKEYYVKALSLGFSEEKTAAALALVEKALGHRRAAEKLLKQADENERASALPKVLLYSLYMEQSRFDEAKKIANDLCEALPWSYLGYHSMLVAFFAQHKYEAAKSYLDSVDTRFMTTSAYVVDYTSTLLLLKKASDADQYWQAHHEQIDKDSLEYARIEAQIASDLQDFDRSLMANKLLYERFGVESAAISAATLLIMEQDFNGALEFLRLVVEAKQFTKAYYSALYLRAFCEGQVAPNTAEKLYSEAIRIYEEAYQKNAVNTYVMSFAAECYRRLGDTKNASRCDQIVSDFKRQQGIVS
jgi:tetratricopeptide (TPR) repeat protein